jgi:ribosomal protein S14
MQSDLPRRDPTSEGQDLSQEDLWHKRPAGGPSLIDFWNHTQKKEKKKKELHGGVASQECEVSGRWQPSYIKSFQISRNPGSNLWTQLVLPAAPCLAHLAY